MNYIDLHTHTNESDGKLYPTDLIDLAIKNNIKTLAITDHDTVNGYLKANDYAYKRGVKLISGVEISTVWAGISIHIVGLNFNHNNQDIKQLLKDQAKNREDRAKIILQRLSKLGFDMNINDIKKLSKTNNIGRPHIAKLMLEKGFVTDMNKAFKKYLGAGKVGDVKNGWVSLEQAVRTIKKAGGMAVIAHPNKYKITRTKLLIMIDHFIDAGGMGIEVVSGKQHADITTKIANIANEKNLYASIGSDFHQHHPHTANIGELGTLPFKSNPIWNFF